MSDIVTLHAGDAPLLVSLPHVGTWLPDDLHTRLVPRALQLEDTDWHLEQLYAFAKQLGASVLVPSVSRYVIDLNRSSDNAPLYPGINGTELCPTRFFSGDDLYLPAQAPTEDEVKSRLRNYWHPYHRILRDELDRLRKRRGYVVLWDGHSIRSELPWLFAGKLPALNLGTANGVSCDGAMRELLIQQLSSQVDFSLAVDGRFKGGYITRHYGQPDQQVHAIQMEMCWHCYMQEAPPYQYDSSRATQVIKVLMNLFKALLQWRPR